MGVVLKRKFWCGFFVDILRVIKYCVKNTQNIWWIRKIVVTLRCVKITQIIVVNNKKESYGNRHQSLC